MPYVIPDAVQEASLLEAEWEKERGLVLGLHQRQERLLDSCTSSLLALIARELNGFLRSRNSFETAGSSLLLAACQT